jgi:hypothetical protein
MRQYPLNSLAGPRKGTKILSQHSRSPGGDLNPEPPEQETTVLTIRQQRPVFQFIKHYENYMILIIIYTLPHTEQCQRKIQIIK